MSGDGDGKDERPNAALVDLCEAVHRARTIQDAVQMMIDALYQARVEGEDERLCRRTATELFRLASLE